MNNVNTKYQIHNTSSNTTKKSLYQPDTNETKQDNNGCWEFKDSKHAEYLVINRCFIIHWSILHSEQAYMLKADLIIRNLELILHKLHVVAMLHICITIKILKHLQLPITTLKTSNIDMDIKDKSWEKMVRDMNKKLSS